MVVFVLRHADRKPNPDDDLTLAGIERVKLLVRMFTETRVSVAFRSQWVPAPDAGVVQAKARQCSHGWCAKCGDKSLVQAHKSLL
jgi:hypothetical protein